LAAVGVLVLAVAPMARADTYRPNGLGDHVPDGCTRKDCTLREAIIRANDHAGADTVVLRAGKTYTLHQDGTTENANLSGDLDVLDPLTIASSERGPRATIDANQVDGVIETGFGVRLTVASVVISGGESSAHAGGIEADGPLNLSGAVVTRNRGDTGGIDLSDDSTFSRSIVSRNVGVGTAADGGIVSSEQFKLVKSKVVNNHVDNTGGDVGGIDNSGKLVLVRSEVNGNVGGDDNGAGLGGGGIFTDGRTIIKHSTVNGNRTVLTGGGISQYAPVNIIDSSISGNHADGDGGGIYHAEYVLTLLKSRISNNRTGDSGGGIDNHSALTVERSTISGNRTLGGSGVGGGLNLRNDGFNPGNGGGDVALVQSTVSGNSGRFGGGMAVNGDSPGMSLSATNSTIVNNKAAGTGGGIDVFGDSDVTLRSVTVVRNSANIGGNPDHNGGGLFNDPLTTTTVRNSIVALNTVGAPSSGPDCYGTFVSEGRNLFTDLSDCSGFARPPNIRQANPHLGKLSDNGGLTETVALLNDSKAINHAGAGSPTRDQRGHKRHDPDIGAFER
jgi:hypothetical protein